MNVSAAQPECVGEKMKKRKIIYYLSKKIRKLPRLKLSTRGTDRQTKYEKFGEKTMLTILTKAESESTTKIDKH